MSDIVYKKIGFSTPFLRGYQTLRIPIVDADGTPAWPEKFPLSVITDLQSTVGARHFASQMMLTPVSPERVRLDPGAMHFYNDEFNPQNAHIGDQIITGACIYWDPSLGRSKSDGSVCVIIYRDDKSHRIFIHDVLYLMISDNDEHPMATQCERVLKFMAQYSMNRICVETNGIGNALPFSFSSACRSSGVLLAETASAAFCARITAPVSLFALVLCIWARPNTCVRTRMIMRNTTISISVSR
jgi:hypothetical protein